MTKNELIASKIKLLREEKNYLLEDIALKLGISVPSYSRIESGKIQINVETLYKLTQILDTDLYEIFNLEKNNSYSNNSDNVLCQFGQNHFLMLNLDKKDIHELKKQILDRFNK